jgi:prepilin-type processing-associated H-X9-DG protein
VDAWPAVNDKPARNLFDGDKFAGGGLSRIAIPRHAAQLSAATKNFNPKDTLPGAVNVSFADNHAELVKLEKLWDLYWHKNWEPPAKRPGQKQQRQSPVCQDEDCVAVHQRGDSTLSVPSC